jgi:hypothetical protein
MDFSILTPTPPVENLAALVQHSAWSQRPEGAGDAAFSARNAELTGWQASATIRPPFSGAENSGLTATVVNREQNGLWPRQVRNGLQLAGQRLCANPQADPAMG